MKVEYKKDLRNNYMVISECECSEKETYSVKMLKYQSIAGILPLEARSFDNKMLLYYDITARQSMAAIYEKTMLTKIEVQQLCTGIINSLEAAYEYLLLEDDFILNQEYIYIEIGSGTPMLCYLPGYHKSIKEQMSMLVEYLMNRVDYNDREAVLLVYRLYAVSREEGYTFEHLMKELNGSMKSDTGNTMAQQERTEDCNPGRKAVRAQDMQKIEKFSESYNAHKERHQLDASESKSIYKAASKSADKISNKAKPQLSGRKLQNNMPVMLEKLEGEEEVSYYPWTAYLYTGFSIAGGIGILIICLVTKILYNSYGSRLDFVKLAALLLMILCVEGYFLKRIWDKKNTVTRLVTKSEYVDPRQEDERYAQRGLKKLKIKDTSKDKPEGLGCENQLLKESQAEDEASPVMVAKALENNDESCKETKDYSKPFHSDRISNPLADNRLYAEEDPAGDNPTCLLNASLYDGCGDTGTDLCSARTQIFCQLKALDEEQYQTIIITEFPFFIGKLKKNVDYCLKKEVISRYHAKLTLEENRYYLTDLNSMNGTFLNGTALQTYEKMEIKNNDEIAFANICYRFERLSSVSTKGIKSL